MDLQEIKRWLPKLDKDSPRLPRMEWLIDAVDRLATANADLQQRLDAAEESLKVAQGEVQKRKDEFHADALYWRGIDEEYGGAKVCNTCGGSGQRGYGSTSTWRGGVGGQMVTGDVCDKCWGSGDINNKGADLRRFTAELQGAKFALTAANSRVEELTAEVARLSRAMEFQGCMTVDEVNQEATELIVHLNRKAEAANSRVERLREALAWCYNECREVRLCEDITFGGMTIKQLADYAKEGM